ncbi:MAG: hypothetical protein ABDH32_01660 [Candidatus Caldarchaeales archaeon]
MYEGGLPETYRSMLFFTGIFLIFLGLIIALLGLITSTDIRSGGLILIGPIPFFFYLEDPSIAILIILISFLLIFTFITYMVFRKR